MSTRRPRSSSAPGSGRGRSGRRPAGSAPTTRSTTRASQAGGEQAVVPRSKPTTRAAILLLVLAILAVSYASSARAWLNQRSHNNDLRAEIATLQDDVSGLRSDKRRWNDDEFLKSQARERFGWVLPGEIAYRVIDEDGEVIAGGSSTLTDPATPATEQDQEWWSDAWGTVVDAGADPAARTAPVDEPEPADRIGGRGDGSSKQR